MSFAAISAVHARIGAIESTIAAMTNRRPPRAALGTYADGALANKVGDTGAPSGASATNLVQGSKKALALMPEGVSRNGLPTVIGGTKTATSAAVQSALASLGVAAQDVAPAGQSATGSGTTFDAIIAAAQQRTAAIEQQARNAAATQPTPAVTAAPVKQGAAGAVSWPKVSSSVMKWADHFAAAGAKHQVDPRLLAAVAQAESGGNTRAVSPVGAQGLMQFMPATAKGLGVNPLDPASAIDGAARLLRQHLDRFGSTELALAAYNAGPGAVSKYGGIPPYAETQGYVRKITALLRGA